MARVPEFWDWLMHVGQQDHVKVPIEVYEEIKDGNDVLALWAKQDIVEEALLLQEAVEVEVVAEVTEQGYAADLTDVEVEKIGRDPFLVAYAYIDTNN